MGGRPLKRLLYDIKYDGKSNRLIFQFCILISIFTLVLPEFINNILFRLYYSFPGRSPNDIHDPVTDYCHPGEEISFGIRYDRHILRVVGLPVALHPVPFCWLLLDTRCGGLGNNYHFQCRRQGSGGGVCVGGQVIKSRAVTCDRCEVGTRSCE